MRARRQIGNRNIFAGQPVALFQQKRQIFQMQSKIVQPDADGFHVRAPAAGAGAHKPSVDFFIGNETTDFVVKLVIKPGDQAAHFGARQPARRQERQGTALFLKPFGNRVMPGNRARIADQYRRFARRVQHQEIEAAFPRAFFNKFHGEFFFAKHQTNFARKRADRLMKKTCHIPKLSRRPVCRKCTVRAGKNLPPRHQSG